MLNTSYCVKACDPVVARIFGDSQVAEKHTSDLMGRRFRNPWVRRLDPSLIPFPKTGQGYTKFPVNYIFLSVNRFFFNKQVYDETCITAPGIYRHLRYVNELYYLRLCFSISTYFFFLCLFSFVYVVSGNETAAIRSKLLLESCTEMMISLLELLLLFFGERPLSLSDL